MFEIFTHLQLGVSNDYVSCDRCVAVISTIPGGHYVSHAGLDGGVDYSGLPIVRRAGTQCNNKDFLAPQSSDKGGVIVMVD